MPRLKTVSLSLLSEPANPSRTTMDDVALDDLAASIRELGVIEPLVVGPLTAGHHEIVAGHRRYKAAQLAGLVSVPCVVHETMEQAAAMQLHENVQREELNPWDEAVWLAEIYEKNGQDTERLAALVRRSRNYVEDRLLLLRGYPRVQEALKAGTIGLGVAKELNRLQREEDVSYYLESALRSGATTRQMREWVSAANARAPIVAAALEGSGQATDPVAAGEQGAPHQPSYMAQARPWELSSNLEPRACLFCNVEHPEWKMFRMFSCDPCRQEYATRTGR